MTRCSRRHFLKALGAFTGLVLTNQEIFGEASKADDFEFLVVGDSLVWGQGLREEDKFYYLTKEWLQNEVFGAERQVNLRVKAHSGSRIMLHDDEREILLDAGFDLTERYPPEVNITFPSIWTQIDLAREAYEAENIDPQAVRLIMLTGGITDISITELLNPFADNDRLREKVTRFCYYSMLHLLRHSARTFPNALTAVVGYHPIISNYSPTSRVFHALLELYNVPRFIQPLINNPLKRALFLRLLQRRMVRRVRIWNDDSNFEFQRAVNSLNFELRQESAVFIKAPLDEGHSYAADERKVWEIVRRGRAEDALYDVRKDVCGETLEFLREAANLRFRERICELASVGHPNPRGSRAFAEKIKLSLTPFFAANGRFITIRGK